MSNLNQKRIIIKLRSSGFKVGLTPSKKKFCYLFNLNPFEIDEKCFLFHLKISFLSQDISHLSRLFGHVEKVA